MTDTTVWKFPLELEADQTVDVAGEWVRGVSVGFDRLTHKLTVWAMVLPGQNPTRRRILIRGTGHPIEGPASFIGSEIADPFVWHVFDGGQA